MKNTPLLRASSLACLCVVLAAVSVAPERPRTALAGRVVAAAPGVNRPRGPGVEAPVLPEGAAPDWWTAIRAQIEQETYAVRPATKAAPGTFEADNPAQRWQARFAPAGMVITPVATPSRGPEAAGPDAPARQRKSGVIAPPAGDDWTFGLRLAAYGAGDALTPVSPVVPWAEGARVEYRYGESHVGEPTLTEWYVNEARGLEHGFTLAEAPSGAGPVTLQLAVAGGLQPVLEPDGLAVELRTQDGAVHLRYADLFVTDARGRTLPSTLSVPPNAPARIHVSVDARDAVYPVTIDPMLTTPSTTLTGQATNSAFGYSVATAGDVNGDGYADIVVGAYSYSSSTGRAYVYLGSASGLATTAATTLTGEATGNSFGYSAATAGDVNGDGYADVVVGAPTYSTNTGRVYVYLGGASGLATPAATTLTGEGTGQFFGFSVAPAGDVNGDGYADVVVGASGYGGNTGRAYVYLGGASGLTTPAATTLTGEAAGIEFGKSAATAGDVNGDGYADVVIGAKGYSTSTGRAYVYLGGAAGLAAAAATTLTGEAVSNSFGVSVATAGDVNGDGYADVVVGAMGYSTNTGRAYVYLGGASGLATAAATTLTGGATANYFGTSVSPAGDVNGDGFADVIVGAYGYTTGTGRAYVHLGGASGLATTAATTLTGAGTGYYFGQSVATAGDVNGDGYADVVVGAPSYSSNTGRAYVYLGGSYGLVTTAAATRTGEGMNGGFGMSVASAGDVNGDGYADIVVGAPYYSSSTGRAYVYLGRPTGLATTAATTLTGEATYNNFGGPVATAGDVNGDGYADLAVGAAGYGNGIGRVYVYLGGATGLATTAATTLTGAATGYYFGVSVATAGDVNGDGFADVMVAATGYNSNMGQVSVYQGGPTGLATTAATTLTGAATSDEFGTSVATAGDVNRDGFADVVVGATGYSTNAGGYSNHVGRAYVYLGGPSGLATAAATTLTGPLASSYFGCSVATAGDVNGDGYSDVVIGAAGYSTSMGRATVYLGGASGLATTAATTMWGASNYDNFGRSVATAGDVNGDGYADVVVGASGYNATAGTGRAYVYLGGASGLGLEPAASTTLTGEATGNYFAMSVATAGDVNGDGYADVVVGAYGYSTSTGRAYVYAGNAGLGRGLAARTRQPDDSAPLAYGGLSDDATGFRLAALGHSPFGRTKVKLQWEVKPLGTAFNGSGTGQGADWQDTTTAGAGLNELATGLTQNTAYHWRVRVLYHPGSNPFARYSRWVTQPWVGKQETRLRTGSANPAPIVTGIAPARGPLTGGTPVTITGKHFVTGQTTVTVGGAEATSVMVASVTSLTAVTPAHAAGVVDVVVTAPYGSATLTNGFTYENPMPPPVFTDDPLTSGSTVVKAVHVTELRLAIDALRTRYGLGAFAWTDATLGAGVMPVKAVHVSQLRTALIEAYTAAGSPAPTYTHTVLTAGTTVITAVDIAELRTAVLAIW